MIRVVCFVALGSWGDVQPMLMLAAAFLSAHPDFILRLVTHKCMKDRIALATSLSATEVRYIDIPILQVESEEEVEGTEDELQLLAHAVGEPNAIVFNLFSIAAYHLAEALTVPCMALHSGAPPPVDAGQRTLRWLRKTRRGLVRALRIAESPLLTWAEIEHWCCPIFNDVYKSWRVTNLGLAADPLAGVMSVETLPPPVPLVYTTSPLLLQPPAYWPASITFPGGFPSSALALDILPPEVPVRAHTYAISTQFVAQHTALPSTA
jgi:hypothetical protein